MWFALSPSVDSGSIRHVMRRALEGEPVRRFMQSDVITAPPTITIRELVDEFFYRYHFKMFPVVENGRLRGCVTTRGVTEVPRDQWQERTVGELIEPCSDENTIRSNDDALKALAKMNRTGKSRLLVVEGGELRGIVSLKDLLKFLSLKVELEGDGDQGAAIAIDADKRPAEQERSPVVSKVGS